MTVLMATAVALALLTLICLLRMFLGPSTPDRLVALDTTNTLAVSLLVVLGAFYQQAIFVDVAIVYAILSFAGTLYFAKFLEGKK